VNEKICRLRPVEETGTWTAEEKTAAAIHQEVAREINQLLGRIFTERGKDGHFDLEAVEMAMRSALHRAGAAALSALLRFPAPGADQRAIPCACGQQAGELCVEVLLPHSSPRRRGSEKGLARGGRSDKISIARRVFP